MKAGQGFEHICERWRRCSPPRTECANCLSGASRNPNVSEPVNRILGHVENVVLIEPQDCLLCLADESRTAKTILTDSGGIQGRSAVVG